MRPIIGAGTGLRAYRRLTLLGVTAGLVLIPSQVALALCASPLRDGNFESQRRAAVSAPWIAEGRAGIDIRRGFSRGGVNNAWARSYSGWNAIRQSVRLSAGINYTLTGWVKTSPNVRAGYFGFRSSGQRPVAEINFGSRSIYRPLQVSFRPTRTDTYYVFAGFWSPGQDAWIRIDDLQVGVPCNDEPGNLVP